MAMSKGFWIAIVAIIFIIGGFWAFGNLYKPNLAETNNSSPEISLTDEERQRLTLAVASNYNYTGNEDKIDEAIQSLNDGSEPTVAEINQFIINEYQKSQSEIEKLARKGSYQAQRNLAFGHATDPEVAGADPAEGCAWYLVLYNSSSPKVNSADLSNIDVYCSAKMLNIKQQRAAEIKAELLLKSIYNKDMSIKINDHLKNYL